MLLGWTEIMTVGRLAWWLAYCELSVTASCLILHKSERMTKAITARDGYQKRSQDVGQCQIDWSSKSAVGVSKPSRSTEMVFLVMWKLTLFPECVQISASGHWYNSISEGLVGLCWPAMADELCRGDVYHFRSELLIADARLSRACFQMMNQMMNQKVPDDGCSLSQASWSLGTNGMPFL